MRTDHDPTTGNPATPLAVAFVVGEYFKGDAELTLRLYDGKHTLEVVVPREEPQPATT